MWSFSIIVFLVTGVLSQDPVIPLHYDITVNIHNIQTPFTSETKIKIQVEEPISLLSLNSRNLIVTDVQVANQQDVAVPAFNFTIDDTTGNVNIQFEVALEPGLYFLTFTSSGTIKTEQKGLYYSEISSKNDSGILYLTDFRYDWARAVFPCFDDPKYISTFQLHLVKPKALSAITGVPLIATIDFDANKSKDTFATSDPIPTYLLAFAIGEFTRNGSVYSFINSGTELLAKLSENALDAFRRLYPYKIADIHQLVVPDSAISKTVLENNGLIIYRESAILYDENHQTAEDKQDIAKLISHAIVAQKHRDIYTWGSNHWITEGTTATYQYDILHAIQPTWRLQEQFLVNELRDVLRRDINNTSVSLVLPENQTPDAFTQDQTVKSYAVFRMLSRFPTPGDILETENNVTAPWTRGGYPTVRTVGSTSQITFIQEGELLRSVPINVGLDSQPHDSQNFDFILENQENFTYPVSSAWYLVNLERLGYYRVNYDRANWERLTQFLLDESNDISSISGANKAMLIEDVAHFSNQGNLEFHYYLNLVQYLEREKDYIPIYSFINTAKEIKARLSKTTTQEKFMTFATSLLQSLYEDLGTSLLPEDTHTDTLSRTKVLTWLCDFGYDKCHDETDKILSKSEPVHPDLQELVYCGGMRKSTQEKFFFLKDQHEAHGHKRILKSMACTEDTEILQYILKAVIGDTSVLKIQEENKLPAYLAVLESSDTGVDVTLAFTKQHLEQILLEFNQEVVSEMFLSLSKKLVTDQQLQMVNNMTDCLTSEQKIQYQQIFDSMLQNIEDNQKWQTRHKSAIDTWLDANVPTEEPTTEPTPSGAGDVKFSTILLMLLCLISFYYHTK